MTTPSRPDPADGAWRDTASLAATGALVGLVDSWQRAALLAVRNAVAHRGALDAAWDEYRQLHRTTTDPHPELTRHPDP